MIIAVLDDLMFTSRIRTAAKGLNADVRFAKTAADAIALAGGERPSLVLIDLNGRGIDPGPAVALLKADPALAGVRVVGFVSHVQTDVIEAARAAGIDEVMARSAFVARLADLLGGLA